MSGKKPVDFDYARKVMEVLQYIHMYWEKGDIEYEVSPNAPEWVKDFIKGVHSSFMGDDHLVIPKVLGILRMIDHCKGMSKDAIKEHFKKAVLPCLEPDALALREWFYAANGCIVTDCVDDSLYDFYDKSRHSDNNSIVPFVEAVMGGYRGWIEKIFDTTLDLLCNDSV